MEKLPGMAPNGAGKVLFRLIQTLPTFRATRILILRIFIFGIFWIPIFQIPRSPNPDPGLRKYHILGPSNCFYWGAAAPQTPCCSWGACSPPDPLVGGLQPSVPPCIPRGSASRALRFFLVRRSWKPLTCGYVAAGAFFFRKVAPIFLEAGANTHRSLYL